MRRYPYQQQQHPLFSFWAYKRKEKLAAWRTVNPIRLAHFYFGLRSRQNSKIITPVIAALGLGYTHQRLFASPSKFSILFTVFTETRLKTFIEYAFLSGLILEILSE